LKLVAPLFSLEAHGTLGNTLTFSTRKSGAQVRFQRAGKDNITPLRTIQRAKFATASSWWQMLTDDEKSQWK